MNIFNNNTTICICCNARLPDSFMHIKVEQIGICKRCFSKLEPITSNMPFEGSENLHYILSSFRYNDKMKKAVHRYKFYRNWKVAELFSALMKDYLLKTPVLKDFDIITAIPLHKIRLFDRGYNQAELIAKKLSEILEVRYESCVFRAKHTLVQSMLHSADRHKNTKDAFVADHEKVSGKRIILFDDVCTTRSTLNSCAKELIERGALEVVALTLAITYHI